ncbi:MAG TPA: hypothetical protein PLS53_00080 [Thermoanaerobaculaceae bacterium]|nr:hypothetical protein [Thermoanaerobaculaceae bacterium]
MADTYTVIAAGVALPTVSSSVKSMLSLMNGAGSGKTAKIYRVRALNNQTAAVTGVMMRIELWRLTAASGGTTLTPIKMDSASPAVPAQIVCATGATATNDAAQTNAFIRVAWSSDEPVASGGTIDELQTSPQLFQIWGCGYTDPEIQPITLPENYGFQILVTNSAATGAGVIDLEVEFTLE